MLKWAQLTQTHEELKISGKKKKENHKEGLPVVIMYVLTFVFNTFCIYI